MEVRLSIKASDVVLTFFANEIVCTGLQITFFRKDDTILTIQLEDIYLITIKENN